LKMSLGHRASYHLDGVNYFCFMVADIRRRSRNQMGF
jgi:hypothetical protein